MSAVDDDTTLADVTPEPGEGPISSTEIAYAEIRKAILNGELPPARIVSQVQLASELNISRTPLREALRRLQTEGLLEGDFNRRVRVAPLSVGDLEQLAAMRIALETLGVRSSVPELSQHDLDRAANAFDEMDRASQPYVSDFDGLRVHHREFHTTLFSKVGDRMRAQLEELWEHAERYRIVYRTTAHDQAAMNIAHDEHAAILEAAQQRDAHRCGRLVAHHLARTALTAIAGLDATHDPRLVREAVRFAAPGA